MHRPLRRPRMEAISRPLPSFTFKRWQASCRTQGSSRKQPCAQWTSTESSSPDATLCFFRAVPTATEWGETRVVLHKEWQQLRSTQSTASSLQHRLYHCLLILLPVQYSSRYHPLLLPQHRALPHHRPARPTRNASETAETPKRAPTASGTSQTTNSSSCRS